MPPPPHAKRRLFVDGILMRADPKQVTKSGPEYKHIPHAARPASGIRAPKGMCAARRASFHMRNGRIIASICRLAGEVTLMKRLSANGSGREMRLLPSRFARGGSAPDFQRLKERANRSEMALRPLASRKRVPVAVKCVCSTQGAAISSQASLFQENQASFS